MYQRLTPPPVSGALDTVKTYAAYGVVGGIALVLLLSYALKRK